MVILGLGSNLGDRFQHLRTALNHLKNCTELTITRVSPVYLSDALLLENADAAWNKPYLNLAIRLETQLHPHELLIQLKQIEKKQGREFGWKWGPRPIDIDILAWDDLQLYDDKLHIPHKDLIQRPFALWPLADVAPDWIYPLQDNFLGKTAWEIAECLGSRFDGKALCRTRQIQQRIDTPVWMGIINITPDSFSDGDKDLSLAKIDSRAKNLMLAGAQIIDIGAEATNPNVLAIDEHEEWRRLELPLKTLLEQKKQFCIPPIFSVDTRHAATAEKALALGIDIINDQSGLADKNMLPLLLSAQKNFVVMHHLGLPVDKNMHYPYASSVFDQVYRDAETLIEKMTAAGMNPAHIIFDVGIGFGKTGFQNNILLQRIAEFKRLGVKLLVGPSRKSFLQQYGERAASDRDIETLAVVHHLAKKNIDYVRLHNIDICARFFKVAF